MFVETAFSTGLTKSEKRVLVAEGHDTYNDVFRRGTTARSMTGSAAAASLRLAVAPSVELLVVNQSLPTPKVAEQDYAKLTMQANKIADCIDANRPGTQNVHHVGISSEASVWLLLMRFGKAHVPGEYVPYFSFLTEDVGNGQRQTNANRWDISVFAQVLSNQPPSLAHKIQVKTSSLDMGYGKTYAEDIAVVYTLEDLRTANHPVFATTVVRECLVELEEPGCERISTLLDAQTDKLLDLI